MGYCVCRVINPGESATQSTTGADATWLRGTKLVVSMPFSVKVRVSTGTSAPSFAEATGVTRDAGELSSPSDIERCTTPPAVSSVCIACTKMLGAVKNCGGSSKQPPFGWTSARVDGTIVDAVLSDGERTHKARRHRVHQAWRTPTSDTKSNTKVEATLEFIVFLCSDFSMSCRIET